MVDCWKGLWVFRLVFWVGDRDFWSCEFVSVVFSGWNGGMVFVGWVVIFS